MKEWIVAGVITNAAIGGIIIRRLGAILYELRTANQEAKKAFAQRDQVAGRFWEKVVEGR